MARSTPARRSPRRKRAKAALTTADFRAYLVAKAEEVAATDVSTLIAQARTLRVRAASDRAERPVFARRVETALDLLTDHARGRCPQIPFGTVSLLTAALFYYLDPLDVIPDFISRIGTGDDALVLEAAYTLGAGGLRRYCDWAERPADGIVPAPRRIARRRR